MGTHEFTVPIDFLVFFSETDFVWQIIWVGKAQTLLCVSSVSHKTCTFSLSIIIMVRLINNLEHAIALCCQTCLTIGWFWWIGLTGPLIGYVTRGWSGSPIHRGEQKIKTEGENLAGKKCICRNVIPAISQGVRVTAVETPNWYDKPTLQQAEVGF